MSRLSQIFAGKTTNASTRARTQGPVRAIPAHLLADCGFEGYAMQNEQDNSQARLASMLNAML